MHPKWIEMKLVNAAISELLTYGNVDMSTKTLRFQQKKVEGHRAHSVVVFPLSDDLMALIGKPTEPYNHTEKIFNIPEYGACDRHLKRWVKAAGINKFISWDCSRHSFVVDIFDNGANIKTEKYLYVLDRQKKAAVDSLGTIGFSM